MCGIVGYIGKKQALPVLISGLRDLEYRGYDSAGVAVLHEGKISRARSVGKVDSLVKKIGLSRRHSEGVRPTEESHTSKDIHHPSDALRIQSLPRASRGDGALRGHVGIAHTRWATHGGVVEENAHPHFALDGKLAIVHNGIVENYRELKKQLEKEGVVFTSETDTEVLAHLIGRNFEARVKSQESRTGSDLVSAVKASLLQIRGTYGLAVMHADFPDLLVAARLGSPLVIGPAEGEFYIASDVTPMLPYTKQAIFLDDGEVAKISLTDGLKIYNLKDELIQKNITTIDWTLEKAQKGGFEHFMLKEIFDQPTVFEDAIRGRIDMEHGTARLGGLNMTEDQMRQIQKIVIIAEGTAKHAGMIAKYAFERLANISTEVDFSSEFLYRDPVVNKSTLVFAISQSGETADTILAIREAKRKGAVVRGIVNTVGSTIAREVGAGSYIHAGPELSVASTKAFTNMVAVLLLYALEFGRMKHTSVATGQRILQAFLEIPEKMNKILAESAKIKQFAEVYKSYNDMFFVSRGVNYPVALEGALKMKEISYIHAEGMGSGEMKHGSLAIISKDLPLIAIMTKNSVYEKTKSNVQEARSRGARTFIVATEGDEDAEEVADDIIYVPKTMELVEPILNNIPLQLFAYYVSVALGRDVDRPRNLAKSVTVE